MKKKALILCAGFGTRLRPLTDNIPKCLVPIRGKPVLEYWLDRLITGAGYDQILVNTHYLPEQVERYIAASPFKQKVQLVHEPELLGTGGTLKANRHFFDDADDFVLAHGDNYTSFDPEKFLSCHLARPSSCAMTMLLFNTDTPESCGIVETDGRGVVQAFHEKVKNPPSNKANGAVYYLNKEIFQFLERFQEPFIDFSTQVIPSYMGKIMTFNEVKFHLDIGTMESWQQAQTIQ